MKGSRLSKKCQARIVEATVVSSLLYDRQARVWWARDIKRLQSWVDRYMYIWGNRNRQPLREMQDRHSNMEDVRTRLGVRSIKCRIEKMVLERKGHLLRMGNDRITEAVVLGWWEDLEGREKKVRKKRKTVLYWALWTYRSIGRIRHPHWMYTPPPLDVYAAPHWMYTPPP